MLRRADRPARGRPGRSWPDSMVPTCVVHLIRASMRFVAHKGPQGGRRRPAPDLHRPRRGGRPTGPGRLPPVRPGPQVPADGGDVGEGLGEEHRLPGLPPGPAPGHLHHQRDRVAELPAAQGHQEPRPLPLRRGGGQTAVAGDLQHRGPPGRGARQGEEHARPLAQGQGQTRRGTGHHQLEAGPGPARRRLPRPNQPPSLTEPAYTETLTGSLPSQVHHPQGPPRPGPRGPRCPPDVLVAYAHRRHRGKNSDRGGRVRPCAGPALRTTRRLTCWRPWTRSAESSWHRGGWPTSPTRSRPCPSCSPPWTWTGP